MSHFNNLNLSETILKSLEAMKFEKPTPIQELTVPLALAGKDIVGCAQTGTGKTAAFSIPLVTHLIKNPQARALVLAPTRELAEQIVETLKALTEFNQDIRGALLIGGTSMIPQLRNLQRRPRIIVATPGRLNDHLRRGSLELKAVEFLVLDEADRMLDMGFAPQLEEIARYLPTKRQSLLFSATIPLNIKKLSAKYLTNPEYVKVEGSEEPVKNIDQAVISTTGDKKNEILLSELSKREGSVLIFTRTKSRTHRLTRFLNGEGYKASEIHGDRSQSQRKEAIQGFREGKFRVLVATDIAARGIDISHIAHVINYDLPQVAEDFVHRIGRTGRNGASGQALSLVTREELILWRQIVRLTQGNFSHADKNLVFAGSSSATEAPTRKPYGARHGRGGSGGGGGGGNRRGNPAAGGGARGARRPFGRPSGGDGRSAGPRSNDYR